MIWGLPLGTFFFSFISPALAIVFSIVYAVTFKPDNKWKTFEDIFGPKNKRGGE